jgi:hypothetical protein
MKNRRIKLAGAILATATGLLFTSCGKKGCTDPLATNYDQDATKHDASCEYATDNINFFITDATVDGVDYKKVEGTIDKDYTFTSGTNWLLSGGVFVDGATLTVEAGTEIYAADDGTVPFLSIKQGAKIIAEGTSSAPIVFTTVKANPTSGSWGGIIVNGYADINTGETAEGEGGTGLYGGTDDTDNSGVLKYVRVEYAGKLLSADNELNSFSFNGVGSGTTLEYLQAYKGADDGFEFFGGTVSMKYAVSSGIEDDSYDWTHGWRGNGQFWVANQGSTGGDRGIEADNNGDNNTATPYSNPTLANITLVGNDDGDGENTGMRLREGTKASIYNAIVINFPKNGIRVSDTESENHMAAGTLDVANSISFNNGTNWKDCSDFENDASNESIDPSLNGYIGTTSANAFEPTSLSSWFTSAAYKGAVSSSNDWTAGWTKGL